MKTNKKTHTLLVPVLLLTLQLSSCQQQDIVDCANGNCDGSVITTEGETPAEGRAPASDDSTPGPIEVPVTPTPSEDFDYLDIASIVGREVDDYYSSYRELEVERGTSMSHETDYCHDFSNSQRFSESISYYVEDQFSARKLPLQNLKPYYYVPGNLDDHKEVGFTSHKLCRVSSSTMSKTMGRNIPGSDVIAMANEFANRHNDLREKVLSGNQTARFDLNKLWTKFMSCLAYTESLTTADSSSSQNVANKYSPSGYRKPAGVKFYYDTWQSSEDSKLNIGLFQFSPKYTGNINYCVKYWDAYYPGCKVSDTSKSNMIKMLGSSYQRFNAFCGVNKVLQTFAIQVNTTSTSRAHPDNLVSGRLKAPADRCVTPHYRAGWAYNHFGPLQNSTGSNLKKLLSCALD